MNGERVRLIGAAVGALGLLLASLFVLDWFRMAFDAGALGKSWLHIDLRSIQVCNEQGCVSAGMDQLSGLYPTVVRVVFWSELVLAACIAIQVGTHLVGGTPREGVNRIGYLAAVIGLVTAFLAGYVLGPETGRGSTQFVGLAVTRQWGPAVALVGNVVALVALYFVAGDDLTRPAALPEPQPRLPMASARAPISADPPRARLPDSIPLDGEPLVAARSQSATEPPQTRNKPPTQQPFLSLRPPQLRGVLRFAVTQATLGAVGIQAQLESGAVQRVAWADIVGIVARRLPGAPPYEGAPFVDVVSTPGATLRFLSWSTITGEPLAAADRARALVRLFAGRCPDAKLDAATRAFFDGDGLALQLPDAATLAAHDDRLS